MEDIQTLSATSELFSTTGIVEMLCRFGFNFIITLIISRWLYYKKSHRRDFLFTFILMSVAIFLLIFFMMSMEKGKATMGVGLGLFGLLSVMRYRTDAMPVREMTYLFVIICLSVVHAMGDSYIELFAVDIITLLTIWLCEANIKNTNQKLIMYDDITKISPEYRTALIDDLKERTGLNIVSVEVGHIDFLRDMAMIRITYIPDPQNFVGNDIETLTKFPKER